MTHANKPLSSGHSHGLSVPLEGFEKQRDVCVVVSHLSARSSSLGFFNTSPAVYHIDVVFVDLHFQRLSVRRPLLRPEYLVGLSEILNCFNLRRK